ncbi:choice-of-anchor Q domain-containing protein [Tamlana sp. 2_MG-2023]|uniref:choice-of-anchor Q domain-containing protein n=1 Tax=unclassified Tamlana TaxID=2614803 RepID=UPI0026E13D0B|nr:MULTISPECIES: choice-of-anchor Q domain-containing protein [unclassified Tamlana]MDO6760090.1 choice-of-anchor Q domain-containing protein [Tamlana sp. 2_MG-2023]MDO6790212.1 choice-of-anchor Q domain-containing protein [Tamlana sp. 1_MG-2023]
MKKNYLYLFLFLISTIGFAQTSLNFTINNAIDYGGTGGVTSSDDRIEETITVGGDTYLLKVSCSRDLVLEDLGGGDYIFYSAFSDKETFELLKNGNPINFNFVSIDFDNPFEEGEVTIKNLNGGIFSQNINAGGQEDSFPLTGTITSDNTINSTNITGFEIDEEIANTLNNVGWHNIKLEIPATGPTITPDANNILYVDKNVSSGSADGSSWTNAIAELADALVWAKQNEDPSWATTPLQIWIAEGTYTPGTLETDSFEIPGGVTLLGGFNGTETTADERNWAENPTILSGDLDASSDATAGDSHTIITALNNDITIDGFIVENSYADDDTDNSHTAIGRAGGGIYARDADNLNINHCIFNNNIAYGNGTDNGVGGTIVNFGNTSTTTTITNSLFFNNSATGGGGAISGESGNIDIINCTLANNDANQGGGIHLYASNVTATNCIFTNNSGTNGNINDSGPGLSSAAYSLFYNSTSGNNGGIPTDVTDANNNIINTDPIYSSINNISGYRINSNSPAIDAGDSSINTSSWDLSHNARISNTNIDIGAFEKSNPCEIYPSGIIYVDKNASGNNNGTNWTDAFTNLQSALAITENCSSSASIYIAEGTYTPTSSSDRDINFSISNNVSLYGGFSPANAATDLNTRDYILYKTVLSGNIGDVNDASDNSKTIINIQSNGAEIILDGFSVSDSYNDSYNHSALFYETSSGTNTIKIRNSTINNNYSSSSHSGVIFRTSNHGTTVFFEFNNCVFKENESIVNGTVLGLYSSQSKINGIIKNSLFLNNHATSTNALGSAIITSNNGNASFLDVNVINTTFYNNTSGRGYGIYNSATSYGTTSTFSFYNSIINKTIIKSGGASATNKAVNLYNTFYDDGAPDGNLSLPTYVTDQGGSTDADPLFNDTANNDFSLDNNSPAINAGDNTIYSNLGGDLTNDTDLAGNPRLDATTIDIGAYESQSTLNTDTFNASVFSIYPNPVNHILNIKTPNQKYSYSIYNLQGQETLKANNQTSKTIDVSKLPTGIYMLKLSNNNDSQNFKIIKQ